MPGPNIRLKAPANANRANRLHIGFNEGERLDYLQGFSKRKQERRRYGLAMGKMKQVKQLREERTERRELAREARPQVDEDDIIKPMVPLPSEVVEFADSNTLGMFGDIVSVTTTLDSLGDLQQDIVRAEEEEEEYRQAKKLKTGGVDKAQKYALSFKAIKEKIDATPLTTKRQRAAQRNKSQSHLEGKNGGKGGKKGGAPPTLDAKTLANKAIKTAQKSVGKKKRSVNGKKK